MQRQTGGAAAHSLLLPVFRPLGLEFSMRSFKVFPEQVL